MAPLKSSPLNATVFAVGITSVTTLFAMLFRPYLEPNLGFLFLAAVWVCAWFQGRAGGLMATVAAALSILFFFPRPDIAAASSPPGSMPVRLAAFVFLSLLLTWMTASWRERGRLFSSTLSSITDAVLATDREGRITFLNPVAESLTGWPRNDARGRPAGDILHIIDERTRDPVENPLARVLRDRVMLASGDHNALVSRSGAEVPIEHSASPVRDDAGEVSGAVLVFRDIGKRRQLEEQVTHAQKMDAVGRLAGGVAGDFNNVLTVISGYAELLRAEVPAAGPLRRFVDEIIYAGERAAALTRHLLAFSRGSTAQPRVLELNSVVTGMDPILRRLLGQNIELIMLPASGLGRVKADPAQIEQVIVNLAANSRDAMPEGGKLVIETSNVELDEGPASENLGVKPGSYVMLAVSDTGVGMDSETRSRLFEPFFTTKAPGKGAGLGLATVYGVVKQSEGQVTVYSQPGCGTIFEIYLPRVTETAAEPVAKASAKGSESILLVDDEEGVRTLVSSILRSNGYDVFEAGNGLAALAVYDKNAHKIDLVLTDIVMPQMTGIELAQQLAGRSPDLRILYMSGYRDNPLVSAAGGTPRAYLQKPFTPDVLLVKVREVLDAEA
ncbi:MAG TPA: response regulator [Bryobacteraceae bacterium]|nr:response regulator [Bryobacteraceae bacterium]